jgi:hypothetical protein
VEDSFVAALLYHQYRRDSALGLHHVTTAQTGLLWYYNRLQRNRQMADFHLRRIEALKTMMEFGRLTIRELSGKVRVGTVEEANKMLALIEEMHKLMRQTEKELREYV